MCRTTGNGVVHSHVALEPLMQIACLSNVNRNPTAILGLPGIDIISRQGSELNVQGMDMVLILSAGLAGPIAGGGWYAGFPVRMAAEQMFNQVHLIP